MPERSSDHPGSRPDRRPRRASAPPPAGTRRRELVRELMSARDRAHAAGSGPAAGDRGPGA